MTLTRCALLAFTAFILLAFAACSPASNSNTATGNPPDPKDTEVAVLKWHDQALHARSRRR